MRKRSYTVCKKAPSASVRETGSPPRLIKMEELRGSGSSARTSRGHVWSDDK